MLTIDPDGWVIDTKVTVNRFPNLRHGRMTIVRGIVVHQTAASTIKSTLSSYAGSDPNGAHFLIDRDGTIDQTGSVHWKQWHVGKVQVRCLYEHTCTPIEVKHLSKMSISARNTYEMKKTPPARFPSNDDSLGIELVGGTLSKAPDALYEGATPEQNASLKWLVAQLRENFSVPLTEVFRHPIVSYKDPHEAESAQW